MNAHELFQSEGFVHIYEWHDEPGTTYPKHAHKDKVVLYITAGEVTLHFSNGTDHTVKAGERFDVPVGVEHTATVGTQGCDYVVGEMIEGDA